jgi:hypothetical protein
MRCKILWPIFLWPILLLLLCLPAFGETWYVRKDGGTRYSAKQPKGQCDGKADAAYRGKGVNQHCAFKDYRYLWDDQSYGNDAWVIAGGDTVILRDGPWRVGFDAATGKGAGYTWCFGGQGPYACTNPTIPAGTPGRHTRILGENYVNCSAGNSVDKSKVTQIFGGYGVGVALNLGGAHYVDVQCLEITEHNGRCILHGIPAYPRGCNNSGPSMDDYDANGIGMSNTTSNVLLQDLWIHGHTTSGILGPIGGAINLTRVEVSFNAIAGWNFDDGRDTPDAPGSAIRAEYVTMKGNGCNEEYPIVHGFPAASCYDLESGGFGDSWSGQDTTLDSFTCDHCVQAYNTKDGFIGPHTAIAHLTITNSESYGNMGQQWKWGAPPGSTTIFENNLTVGNCRRMSASLPGAPQNYNRYLTLYCRAAGDVFSFFSAARSTVLFANNTTVGYSATIFDLNCQAEKSCGTAKYIFRNNIILGFLNPQYNPANANVPGLFYLSDPSDAITADHNIYFHLRGSSYPFMGLCRASGNSTGNICADPSFVNEPSRTMGRESELDNFNFHLRGDSPAIGHGTAVGGIATDAYGIARPNPPSIGAVEPGPNQGAGKKK